MAILYVSGLCHTAGTHQHGISSVSFVDPLILARRFCLLCRWPMSCTIVPGVDGCGSDASSYSAPPLHPLASLTCEKGRVSLVGARAAATAQGHRAVLSSS